MTCRDLPEWEVDDAPLHAALIARGVEVSQPVWDDRDVPWARFDGVLIRTTWDYVPKREAFVRWARSVEQVVPLWCSADTVTWNTDKSYLRTLERLGIPVVPTVWLEPRTVRRLERALESAAWSRGFLKPVVGASASQTLRFTRDAAGRAAAADHLMAHPVAFMLQPYLAGVESDGERSAILVEGQLQHAVRKQPVPGDYRVQDDHGASDAPHALEPAEAGFVEQVRQVLLERWPELLLARIDWLLAEGQPRLVELELVEPSLFFRHGPATAQVLADALVRRVHEARRGRRPVASL